MIALYIALGIIGAFILFFLLPTMLISNVIYTVLFVRKTPDKWGRTVSWDNEEQQRMFAEGGAWGEENEKYRKTLEIKSEGFKLVAEYFDFGFDRVVIIIPGRMESGTYSYYFSEPYKKSGFNVLAIDNRCHGLSEGKYNCIGLQEYKDILNWAKYMHENENMKGVMIHGICIGSATGLYAFVNDNAPEYLLGLVADGIYVNFNESLNNHLIERKKPIFPFSQEVMWMMTMVAHKNPKKHSPINLIHKMKKPMLFIYSKEDTYSLPELGKVLYEKCGSEKKRIVFFEHGVHSHVRINAPRMYDQTIKEFVEDYINE